MHSTTSFFRKELQRKANGWEKNPIDLRDVRTLPDAVVRVAPPLLLQNSVLPIEPDIAAYCREITEKLDELKKTAEIRESRIAEVEALPDEHVDKFLRACVNALSEERRRGMPSKKKRMVLRHMLEAAREAEVPVDNPFDGEDSEAY